MKWSGSGGITAFAAIRADNHIGVTLPATGNPDGIFGPLNPIYPGPLESGLDDFLRYDDGGRRRAVHLESSPI